MKRMAVLLACSGFWALQATSLEERLENAVRKSDAPQVSYLLRRLRRESTTASVKKSLVVNLVTLSEKVLADEKKSSFLRANDGRVGKIFGGALCTVAGLYLGCFGLEDQQKFRNEYAGFLQICDSWMNSRSQEIGNFYFALSGGALALSGLYLLYDGLRARAEKLRISDAREVRDSLITQSEELGS